MGFRNSILAGEELVRSGIRSPNYVAGVAGWRVAQDGSAELNNVVVRGTLQSPNYVAGTDGWLLDETGFAELNDATIRGAIEIGTGPPTEGQVDIEPDPASATVRFTQPNGEVWVVRAQDGPLAGPPDANMLRISADSYAGPQNPELRLVRSLGMIRLTASTLTAELAAIRMGTTIAPDQMAAWPTYVPAINTIANYGAGATREGQFQRFGRTCHFNTRIVLGGAGLAIGVGNWTLSLPVAAAAGVQQGQISGWYLDGGTWWPCAGYITGGSSVVQLLRFGPGATAAGGPVDANLPFVWGAGDQLQIAGTYQTAAAA